MRVVVTHHVADDLGALAVFGVERQSLEPHGIEDAPLDGLEPVADIGQRAAGDDRERVVEVPRFGGFVQGDSVPVALGVVCNVDGCFVKQRAVVGILVFLLRRLAKQVALRGGGGTLRY